MTDQENTVHPFIERLKNERIRLGLTQGQAGDLIGKPKSRISEMESGKVNVGFEMVAAYAEALGINILSVPADVSDLISPAPVVLVMPSAPARPAAPASTMAWPLLVTQEDDFIPEAPVADDEIEMTEDAEPAPEGMNRFGF